MYHGEVNVAQEELNSFLAVAEDLQVKGLTQNNQTQPRQNPKEKRPTPHASAPPSSPMLPTEPSTIKHQPRVRQTYEQTPTETVQPKRETQVLTQQIKTEAPIVLDCGGMNTDENTQVVEADIYQDEQVDYEFDQSYDAQTMQYDAAEMQGYHNVTGMAEIFILRPTNMF